MKKKLGIWMLTALVIGNMIGSGVFLLPASLAHFGTITIFSWVATAIGATLLALVFSRLSTLFPKTGGPYTYCHKGFGSFIGFQVAYNYWLYIWTGNAAIAIAFTGYMSTFFPSLAESPILSFFVTAGVIWFFTLVNVIGLHFAGIVQLIFTILKFVPLVLITIIGLFFIKSDHFASFNVSGESNIFAFSSGAMLTLWAFLGLESASVPADDVKNPKKTIPKATILGTLMAGAVYILSTVVIMGVVPNGILKESLAPFAELANIIFGPIGKLIVGAAAVISCAGALNGWILLQGQIPYAAAKDGLFPKKFSEVSTNRSPTFGIIISSLFVTLLLLLNVSKNLVDTFTLIISLATLSALIAYLYTTIVEFTIYSKYPKIMGLKKAFRPILISALAFVYVFWAVLSAGKEIVFYGALLMFTSVPIYGWMEFKKSKKQSKGLDIGKV